MSTLISLAELGIQINALMQQRPLHVQSNPNPNPNPNVHILNIDEMQLNTRESFVIKTMCFVFVTIKCNKTWGIFRRHDSYYVKYTKVFGGSKHLYEDTYSKNYASIALCIEDIKRVLNIDHLDEVRVLSPSRHGHPNIIL